MPLQSAIIKCKQMKKMKPMQKSTYYKEQEHTTVVQAYRFLARNTSLSTLSGFRDDRRQVTMFPPVLKTLSEGALVAGMLKYFLGSFDSRG